MKLSRLPPVRFRSNSKSQRVGNLCEHSNDWRQMVCFRATGVLVGKHVCLLSEESWGFASFWTETHCSGTGRCLNGGCVPKNEGGTCVSGAQRCIDADTFQTCVFDAQQQLVFGADQHCATGTRCYQAGANEISCI